MEFLKFIDQTNLPSLPTTDFINRKIKKEKIIDPIKLEETQGLAKEILSEKTFRKGNVTQAPAKELPWDKIFDYAFCINLISRPDRKESCDKIFDRLGIKVEYYHPIKHPTDGRIGCFDAHLYLINLGLQRGYKRVAIFEDDIEENFRVSYKMVDLIGKFLQIEESDDAEEAWNIYFLGCIPEIRTKQSTPTYIPFIHKIAGLCTHAYVINHHLMKKMANMKWMGISIDHIFAQLDQCYTQELPIFIQGNSISDIHKNLWDLLPSGLVRVMVDVYTSFINYYAFNLKIPIYSTRFNIFLIVTTFICTYLWCKGYYKGWKTIYLISLFFTIMYILLKFVP